MITSYIVLSINVYNKLLHLFLKIIKFCFKKIKNCDRRYKNAFVKKWLVMAEDWTNKKWK